jgi:hypothetical protein
MSLYFLFISGATFSIAVISSGFKNDLQDLISLIVFLSFLLCCTIFHHSEIAHGTAPPTNVPNAISHADGNLHSDNNVNIGVSNHDIVAHSAIFLHIVHADQAGFIAFHNALIHILDHAPYAHIISFNHLPIIHAVVVLSQNISDTGCHNLISSILFSKSCHSSLSFHIAPLITLAVGTANFSANSDIEE